MLTVYRKYRAKNFSQIIGQDHVVSVLKQAVHDGKISHAYLFTGPRGTGKTSMARILAKAVNCLDLQDGEPCNKCHNCKAINKGNFLDLIEIDAASNRGIDEIRELKNNVGFLPVEGRHKVYIIDEVHMLTEPAFNALLKTIEEPPQQVLFILATTEPQKIPLTIISRTQRFDFKLADNNSLQKKLSRIIETEKRIISPEALEIIVKAGRGSFRDAETVLEKVISGLNLDQEIVLTDVETILGLASHDLVGSFIEALLNDNRVGAFEILAKVESGGVNLSYFIKELLEEIRVRMMADIKFGNQAGNIKKSLKIVKEFNAASIEMRSSLVPILSIEVAIANLTSDNPVESTKTNSKESMPVVEHTVKKKETKEAKEEVAVKEEVKINPANKINNPNVEKQVEDLKKHWKGILDAAKKYNHFLTAILAKVQLEADEGMVVFKVGSTFHKKRLENKETRKILSGLFTEQCGFDIDYKCIIELAKNKDKENISNSKLVEEFFS
jgi:DNA polymerase-3 subunit gamma/tau